MSHLLIALICFIAGYLVGTYVTIERYLANERKEKEKEYES